MATPVEVSILLKAKDEASSVLGNVAKAAAGVGLAFIAAAGVAIKAAADEEVGMKQLATAARNAGVDWAKLGDATEKQVTAWQRMSSVADDEIRPAFALLIAQTGSLEKATAKMPAALNLSRGANIDLAAASKLLGKLTDENVNVFKKLGLTFKEGATEADVMAAVMQKFGGQAAAFADTAAGQMAGLQNEIGDMVEEIGFALLPIFKEAIGMVRGFLAAFSEGGGLAGVADAFKTTITIFQEFFGVLTGSAPDAGAALSKAFGPEAAGLIMGALALLRETFQQVFGTITLIIKIFTGQAAIGSLQDAWNDAVFNIMERLNTLGTAVVGMISGLIGNLIAAAPQIRDQLLQWAGEFMAWVLPAAGQMLNEMMALAGQLIQFIGDHAEDIGLMLVEWGKKFGEFVITVAIPTLLENLPPILVAIAGWVLTEAIPGVIRIFFNLGKGIVSGILEGLGELKTAVWNAIYSAFQAIDFWVGPFHVSARGISVSMPAIQFPSFAVGTPFVPQDMLAVVHKGEAIIPANQNRGGMAGEQTIVTQVFLNGSQIAEAVGQTFTQQRRMQGLA